MKRCFCILSIIFALILGRNIVSLSKQDTILQSNVEALAGDEDAGCTGPKKENIAGNIFCHCTNTAPCKDLFGCD